MCDRINCTDISTIYEKTKKPPKKAVFRMFRQLPAKMSPEALDFSDLWEDTVEMRDTRLRELTHDTVHLSVLLSAQ